MNLIILNFTFLKNSQIQENNKKITSKIIIADKDKEDNASENDDSPTTEEEEEEEDSTTTKTTLIKRSDSPGLDLSVFQPRGKRKCVIQNELKKQRTDNWYSDEEEEEEEEEEVCTITGHI